MFPEKGTLRIKCMIDHEGDYVAAVQVFRGWFSGWRNMRSYYSVASRTPEEAVRLARQYVAEHEGLELGVLK